MAHTTMYDLVVRNARVAVKARRIAAVGTVSRAGAVEHDAGGEVLAPGVIDVHTHYDAQRTRDPTASPSPAPGVTTVVIGN